MKKKKLKTKINLIKQCNLTTDYSTYCIIIHFIFKMYTNFHISDCYLNS